MLRKIYTLLFYCAVPLMLVHRYWRLFKVPASSDRLPEFLGFYPKHDKVKTKRTVIFHAVSVGEVHAATPLIREFLHCHPDVQVVITTSTATGSERVRNLFGDSIQHAYLPYDTPGAIARFLNHFSPVLLIILETELWPNLIQACHQRGIPLLLGNARLSAKSARGYARFGSLTRDMLQSFDYVAAQSNADARRFKVLGLPADRIVVTGNMKYDMWFDEKLCDTGRELRRRCFGKRPVLIAISTREGEDEKVLQAFRLVLAKLPKAGLILVPRHPERFTSATELCNSAGLLTRKRSMLHTASAPEELQVLVGDSMGETPGYLSAADVAFVGGSLVGTGCQNIIEPAALGIPVITGPSLYNFRQASKVLRSAGAMRIVTNARELADVASDLLMHAMKRNAMTKAAKEVIQHSSGASKRTFALIDELLV